MKRGCNDAIFPARQAPKRKINLEIKNDQTWKSVRLADKIVRFISDSEYFEEGASCLGYPPSDTRASSYEDIARKILEIARENWPENDENCCPFEEMCTAYRYRIPFSAEISKAFKKRGAELAEFEALCSEILNVKEPVLFTPCDGGGDSNAMIYYYDISVLLHSSDLHHSHVANLYRSIKMSSDLDGLLIMDPPVSALQKRRMRLLVSSSEYPPTFLKGKGDVVLHVDVAFKVLPDEMAFMRALEPFEISFHPPEQAPEDVGSCVERVYCLRLSSLQGEMRRLKRENELLRRQLIEVQEETRFYKGLYESVDNTCHGLMSQLSDVLLFG